MSTSTYTPNLHERLKQLGTITIELTCMPDEGDCIAIAGGDDWKGLIGAGPTPRKALLELLDDMEKALENGSRG